MKLPRAVVVGVLYCLASAAMASTNLSDLILSETVKWTEEVLQSDGSVLVVERAVKYGPVGLGSGSRQLREQVIRFRHDGKNVEWKNDDPWPIPYMPDVLDSIGGMPVLVIPVFRWGPCYKYGFPPEGIVAFGYRQGRWERISTDGLSKELRVNLMRGTHELKYDKRFESHQISVSDKREMEGVGFGLPKQGTSLDKASGVYASRDEPCIQLRPPSDPRIEAARQLNVDAERKAPTVQAAIVSIDRNVELALRQTRRPFKQGRFSVVAEVLANSCETEVEDVELLYRHTGDEKSWRSELIGYEVLLRDAPVDRQKVQIEGAIRTPIEVVTCDRATVFVIRRQDKQTVIVHRFTSGGNLINAFRVMFPDHGQPVDAAGRDRVYEAHTDGNGNLVMSVVDISEMRAGRPVSWKVNYAVRMPPA